MEDTIVCTMTPKMWRHLLKIAPKIFRKAPAHFYYDGYHDLYKVYLSKELVDIIILGGQVICGH